MDAPSKCPRCGTVFLPGSKFCRICGSPLPGEDREKTTVLLSSEKETVLLSSESVSILPAGTLLNQNHYRINGLLGQGGFGITYDGTDLLLNVHVAIKEYFPKGLAARHASFSKTVTSASSDDRTVYLKGLENFLKEAQNLAKFSGEENFVHVSNFFRENGTAYIVMEFVDGFTIAEYLKEHGPMSFEQCMRYMEPVMMALDKVHQQNMIHRDVSPANIMILRDLRRVKILDFGAAREVSHGSRTLSVILRPDYAPVEQYYSHHPQGSYTDVYALCATIHTMLTNRVPMSSIARLSGRLPLKRPSEYGAVIDRAQEDVLMKGLAVSPEDRIRTMPELLRLFKEASECAAVLVQTPQQAAVQTPVYGTGITAPLERDIITAEDREGDKADRLKENTELMIQRRRLVNVLKKISELKENTEVRNQRFRLFDVLKTISKNKS